MRNTDEQLREIMRRAGTIKEKRAIRKHLLASAAASCLCGILLIAVFMYLPRLTTVSQDFSAQRYGSLLLTAPYMGYVMVSLLAFALGICVALLCIFWKKLKETERNGQ